MGICKLILFFAYFEYAHARFIFMKLPKVNITGANMTTHLKYAHIQNLCTKRDTFCKSNDTKLCTVRKLSDNYEYKDFENSCFMFMSNMCDNPGKEYSIADSGPCNEEMKSRRMYVYSGVGITTTKKPPVFRNRNSTMANGTALRTGAGGEFEPLYEVETAFDYHVCPLRCPAAYQPVCVSANRGLGKYFKFWTFVNHCTGDLYYCKNWQEFEPPEGEEENVNSSPLAWSFCGAHRYLQFARFAETTSAMGHYGWLSGDYRYSHIMEPHQIKPGFG